MIDEDEPQDQSSGEDDATWEQDVRSRRIRLFQEEIEEPQLPRHKKTEEDQPRTADELRAQIDDEVADIHMASMQRRNAEAANIAPPKPPKIESDFSAFPSVPFRKPEGEKQAGRIPLPGTEGVCDNYFSSSGLAITSEEDYVVYGPDSEVSYDIAPPSYANAISICNFRFLAHGAEFAAGKMKVFYGAEGEGATAFLFGGSDFFEFFVEDPTFQTPDSIITIPPNGYILLNPYDLMDGSGDPVDATLDFRIYYQTGGTPAYMDVEFDK